MYLILDDKGDPMDYFIQFQINLFALIGLGGLYFVIHKKAQSFNYATKIMTYLIIANAIALIAEPLTWIFDNKQYFGTYFIGYSSNFILYLMSPIVAGLIASYVDYKIFYSKKRLIKQLHYQHATIFMVILLIINFFTPIFFTIDSVTNDYQRASFKWVENAIVLGFYIYVFLLIIKHRNKTTRLTRNIFIIFFLLPILGLLIQIIDSRLHFSWTSIVLGLFMVYTLLEASSGDIDYLTKLYSRYSYRTYIKGLIEEEKPFGVLFIDLDGFKAINDKYGHQIGDNVLIEFSAILKKSFHKEPMISRIAGDEFIVVIEQDDTLLDQRIKDTYQFIKNTHLKTMSSLGFSYGYQKHELGMDSDEIFDKADFKMYQDKATKNK